ALLEYQIVTGPCLPADSAASPPPPPPLSTLHAMVRVRGMAASSAVRVRFIASLRTGWGWGQGAEVDLRRISSAGGNVVSAARCLSIDARSVRAATSPQPRASARTVVSAGCT